ncbi:YfhO family protein [uncultured Enterovirga sp.]|uniref:YfhO family protein n=1 Tax=uncultured Enterovirga sp. TaxID=2026352 RepID=UPI0035CA12BA
MRVEFAGAYGGGTIPADLASSRPDRAAAHGAWAAREAWVASLAVMGFWLAAALVWPLTGSVVPWDSKNHFYPMLRFLSESLASGEWPLWNPYHFSGHPSVADPQSLLFTPTMLLFGWLVPKPSMTLFDLAIFAHLLPGALAMLLIFRSRGWRPEGGVVAAMIFVLGGSASARLQHTGIIFGYGLYPLAFYLLEQSLRRRSYGLGAIFAVVASLMVVGRDQVAFLSGLSLVALLGYHASQSGRWVSYLRERLGPLALMALIGAALLALPVLLTAQFLTTSTRPSFGFGVAAMGSLPPESLATILFANVFGSLRWTYDYWGPDWHSLSEGTWTDRATNYLFVGTIPAVLILWHGLAGGRLLAREFRFFFWLGLVTLVYALGRYTPAFSFIFDSLPGVALYRRPADATFLINIVLAFSGGYLIHRFVQDGAPRFSASRRSLRAAILVVLTVALVVGAIVSALLFAVRGQHLATAAGEIAVAMLAAGAFAWLLVRTDGTARRRAIAAACIVAATGGELIWRNAASALNAEPIDRYVAFRTLPPDQAQGLQVLRTELAKRHAAGERPRVEILGLTGGWQNASMVLQIEDTIGYNPLRLADYERAIGPGENAVDPNLRMFPGTFRGYRCRLAGLLGLEYLVLDRPVEKLPKHFPRITAATLLYGAGSMWVYRLSPGAPRAYLATRLVAVDSETVLTQEELPEFDRTTTALVEQEQVDGLQADYGLRDDSPDVAPVGGSVTIRDYRRNAVSLEVDSDRNAVVVLHDIYYPGWEATVDGKPARILRTNLLFRGVEVGPGRHVVELRFRPLSARNLLAAATGIVGGHGADASERTEP